MGARGWLNWGVIMARIYPHFSGWRGLVWSQLGGVWVVRVACNRVERHLFLDCLCIMKACFDSVVLSIIRVGGGLRALV